MKNRISYIDIAKFLTIFMVLIDHSGNYQIELNGVYDNLKTWVCASHVAMFFILNGFTISAEVNNSDFKIFVKKKIKRLLIPYIIWSLIYTRAFGVGFIIGILYGTNQSLCFAGTDGVLWFLPTMFLSQILFYVLQYILVKHNKIDKFNYVFVAISLLIICLGLKWFMTIQTIQNLKAIKIISNYGFWFGADIALLGTMFIIIGYLFKYAFVVMCNSLSKGKILALATFSIILSFIVAQYNMPNDGWPVVVMARGLYGKIPILFVITAIISMVGIVGISIVLEKCKGLVWIGQNSMTIFLIHIIIFSYTLPICDILNKQIVYFESNIGNCWLVLANSVLCTIICIPLICFIKRYIPNLVGMEN